MHIKVSDILSTHAVYVCAGLQEKLTVVTSSCSGPSYTGVVRLSECKAICTQAAKRQLLNILFYDRDPLIHRIMLDVFVPSSFRIRLYLFIFLLRL